MTLRWAKVHLPFSLICKESRYMIFLASFGRLQIPSLQKFAPESPAISLNAIDKIAKFRHLRVIDIVHEFDDVETP